MFSLYNIWVVARYELLLLYRGWFFRIFALVVIGLLGFFNVMLFSGITDDIPWLMRGVPSAIPYFNMILLNPIQAILCVFLASDFLKRDTRASTVEVIYMRSISNAEYIFGKTLGVVLIFVIMDLLLLFIGGIVNAVFSNIPFQPLNYLFYFSVMALPTIIFAIGITYILMTLFRNPPVTWVVMIGFTAVSLFYLQDKAFYLFDLSNFFLPLAWSDFVGVSDIEQVLLQRAIYLGFGLAFIFITVLFMKRLPQSPAMNRICLLFFIIFGVAALGSGVKFGLNALSVNQQRHQILQVDRQFAQVPPVSVKSCSLNVEHGTQGLAITATLDFTAPHETEQYIFSLNPGFTVQNVNLDAKSVVFERNQHLLSVDALPALADTLHTLTLQYNGIPQDFAAYVDLTDEERDGMNNLFMYKLGKKYGFATPDYVLLTSELLWYPEAGAVTANVNVREQKDFIRFAMQVKTQPGLVPISQGNMTKVDTTTTRYTNELPLPHISLVIGQYNVSSIIVDSTQYNLYTIPDHNYYESYFTDIGDTLQALIRESRNNAELLYNAEYPYSRLSLIEVPLHFMVHDRPLQFYHATVQPEQVMLIENGLKYGAADFGMHIRRQERYRDRSNQSFSAAETQAQLFNMFVNQVLTGQEDGHRYGGAMDDMSVTANLFPNFYSFSTRIVSPDLPVLSKALESMMCNKNTDEGPRFFRRFEGLLDQEKANLLLQDHSLKDILANPEHRDLWNAVLNVKSKTLDAYLQHELGADTFQERFGAFLNEGRFQKSDFEMFIQTLPIETREKFIPWVDNWYNENLLPAYNVTNIASYKLLDGNRTRYQLRFDIQNDQPVDGVVSVSFRMGRGGRFGHFGGGPGGDEEPERIYAIPANSARRVGVLLDSEPRGMTINTLTSRNLPIDIEQRFDDLEMNDRAVPFDGVREIDVKELVTPGELIVDNEDAGFSVQTVLQASMLKRLLGMQAPKDDEYKGFNPWRLPNQWQKVVQSDFWGKTIHSAYILKGGNGENRVHWTVDIPAPGQYKVYSYINTSQLRMFGRRSRDVVFSDLNYIVHHDDGSEPVTVDVENAEPGWVLLGTFYMSPGDTKVELLDKTGGRSVIADAIKWVKI